MHVRGGALNTAFNRARKMNSLTLNWDEYLKYDAVGLANLVSTRQVSATELANQAHAAIEALNPSINAVIEVFDDVVADPVLDGMNPRGKFHGVPLLMKDLGSRMKGRTQESGYAWRADCVAETDDPLTQNLRQAGFNLIGRTTTPRGRHVRRYRIAEVWNYTQPLEPGLFIRWLVRRFLSRGRRGNCTCL